MSVYQMPLLWCTAEPLAAVMNGTKVQLLGIPDDITEVTALSCCIPVVCISFSFCLACLLYYSYCRLLGLCQESGV